MLNRKIQYNKQDLTLFKGRNQYDKVMKEMNEAPKEYETIKALVEEKNNNITNVQKIIVINNLKTIYKWNLIINWKK